MQRLTSTQNPKVRALRALQDHGARREVGQYLVEGVKMVGEALRCAKVVTLLVDEARADAFLGMLEEAEVQGAEVLCAPVHVLEAAASQKTPQGIIAAVQMPGVRTLEALGDRILVLDGVQDPGNVGTMMRTADAAGLTGVLLSETSADPFAPKTLRATMGSVFRLPFVRDEALVAHVQALRDMGFEVISSELGGADFLAEAPLMKAPWALVIGSEAHGVSESVRGMATKRLSLPMRGGAESLNAAVAAGIMMYALQFSRA